MASNRAPLLQQITQSPLLIAQDSQELFQASIEHVVSHEHANALMASAASMQNDDADFWPQPDTWQAQYRPYVVKNGVLQIPVMGVLLSRFPWQLGRWATGYQYIEKAMARGLADGNVQKIAFICDTPGGEVTECFELGDKIYEARGQKPMRAFAANHAYSAGYVIFSSGDDGAVTRSGGVGSIGVVTAHVDYSERLAQDGIKVTFIFAGKHKVDGNPYEKLPDSVKSRIQDRINRIYGVFVSTVARNRAKDESEVRATEALTYDADDAIAENLADRIGSLDDEMVIFADGTEQAEDEEMANDNTISQAAHDAAVASARTEGHTAGKAEGISEGKATGLKEGADLAKARIVAILGCDEAKKRPISAMAAAMDSEMTVDQAKAFMTKLPEEKAAVAATPAPKKTLSAFELAMQKDNPNVGAETGDDDQDGDEPEAKANSILADFASAAGMKRKKTA